MTHPFPSTRQISLAAPRGRAQRAVSPDRLALRRFFRNRASVVGLCFLFLVVVVVALAPVIAQHDPNAVDLMAIRKGPSAEHWLGTDSTGRDVFSRLLYGGQISLMVGFFSAILAVLLGTVIGTLAGWFQGPVDVVLSRCIDVMLSVPPVLVIIVLAGVVGPDVKMLILIIAGLSWPGSARIARSVVLSLRGQEYVEAARVLGSSTGFILRRHLIPGVLPQITVAATLLVSEAILLEAALSFLGAGVRPPQASWGNMLTEAQSITVLSSMPWLWIPAGLVIAVTVLSAMAVGDGLRDALDPKKNL